MELKVEQDNCLGCGICVIACPVNAAISPENAGGNGAKTEEVVMMVENGFIKLFSPEKCEECGTCQMFCPVNAIWSNVLPSKCYMVRIGGLLYALC